MSPKRRAGARGQSSVVARLAQKRSRNPLTSRRWVSVDPGRVQRFARWVSLRQVLAALFLLALFTGTAMSQYVVAQIQGDASSEAPVRVRGLAVQGHERLSASRVAAASGLAPGMLASEIDTAKGAAALNAHEDPQRNGRSAPSRQTYPARRRTRARRHRACTRSRRRRLCAASRRHDRHTVRARSGQRLESLAPTAKRHRSSYGPGRPAAVKRAFACSTYPADEWIRS